VWDASGQIGQAIVRELAKDSWMVLAAGRRLTPLPGITGHVYDVELDEPFSVQAAVAAISQEASEVDLWVYTAGDIASIQVPEMSPQDWQRILAANLSGAFLTTHYSWTLLSEQAHLFYLGAVSERMRLPGLSAYATAKAGLEALADVVRKESRRNVTVVRPRAVYFWPDRNDRCDRAFGDSRDHQRTVQ
jgi:NAD(P)-dependent dehydrogenase (short-subunit alcohol dehydrogenase family)